MLAAPKLVNINRVLALLDQVPEIVRDALLAVAKQVCFAGCHCNIFANPSHLLSCRCVFVL